MTHTQPRAPTASALPNRRRLVFNRRKSGDAVMTPNYHHKQILGSDKHPCIHPGARLALTNLKPCEEPVGQTSLTRRETIARKKTNIAPTLACDHSHCIFVVLVVRLVSETALYEPTSSTPQQGAYMRRAIPVRCARHPA